MLLTWQPAITAVWKGRIQKQTICALEHNWVKRSKNGWWCRWFI